MRRAWVRLAAASFIVNIAIFAQPVTVQEVDAAFAGYNGKIVFQTSRDGNDEIYTVSADGSGSINLTNNSSSDAGAAWSPDGSTIIFSSNRSGSYELWTMASNGESASQFTHIASTGHIYGRYSHDGTMIAYAYWADVGQTNRRLAIVDAIQGTVIHQYDFGAVTFRVTDWHPDNSHVLTTVNPSPNNRQRLIDINDGSFVDLTTTNNIAAGTFSPDGRYIIFHSGMDDGVNNIYRMNSDGSNMVSLAANNTFNGSYSPDGMFITYRLGSSIFTAKADGSDRSASFGLGDQPSWQPIPNTAPTTQPKTLAVQYNQVATLDLFSGSTDTEDSLVSADLTLVGQPAKGTADYNTTSGMLSYTPHLNAYGSDSLVYQVCDHFELDRKCSNRTLAISIDPGPAPTLTKVKIESIDYDEAVGTYTTTKSQPTFSGQTTPFAEVKVEIHSDPIILTTTADAQGYWSVAASQPIPSGDHTVHISATLNGQTTQLDSFVLSVQATIPATGADYMGLRWSGLGLLVAGLYLAGRHRKVRA